MKKNIIRVSIAILLQIIFVFGINQSISGAIVVADPFFLVLFIPSVVTGFIFFPILGFIGLSKKKGFLFEKILRDNTVILIAAIVLIVCLLASSASFFIVADSYLPDTYKSLLPYALLAYALGWELLIALSFIRVEFDKKPRYWIGLPFLIAANYFLWHDLVVVGRYLDEFLPNVYPGMAERVLANYRWWELMLPIREFQGMWQFELIIVYLLENLIGIAGVWHLFQIILILTAFFLSWRVFRSKLFSYILVACLVFSTHIYHAFQYSSITAFYLLQSLFLLFMYLAYVYITSEKKSLGSVIGMVITLVLAAIMYEGWLDFFAGMWLSGIFLIPYFRRNNRESYSRRTVVVFGLINLVFVVYMIVKFTYLPFPHTSGESAIVLAYPPGNFWRGLEDFVSNYFNNLYMTLTNFLPPELVFSNALYQYDNLQNHANPTIVHHYLLYWRYLAGVTATLFFIFFLKILQSVWKKEAISEHVPLLIFLAMTAVNGATHTILRFLPMRIVPFAGYYIFQGVLGFSLCIAYGMDWAVQHMQKKTMKIFLLTVFVLCLLYSAIRRPNYLWHLVEMAGIAHQGPYPNPLAVLIIKIRRMIPGFLL